MDIKYIITKINNNIICSQYTGDDCQSLNIADTGSLTGNIYIGRVENVVKNINSAFVEIENKIKCYYPLDSNKNSIYINTKNNDKVNIGDKLLVQVVNDAHKTKPPTASCKIELTGKFVVLSSDVDGVAVSKKMKNSDICSEAAIMLKDILKASIKNINSDIGFNDRFTYGLIIRSNAVNATPAAIADEAVKLISEYNSLLKAAVYGKFYTLLKEHEPDYISEIVHFSSDNNIEIITDIKESYNMLSSCFADIPSVTVRFYEDSLLPLYKLYSVEKNLTQALSPKVWLKCGGYVIIEQTEAMSVIDVNSGKNIARSKKQSDKEKAALKVNLEAAKEIINQIRLRNLSGIIIIDFINMSDDNSTRQLMSYLRELAKKEHIQTNVVDITPLGLVEMTRKNNGKTLKELIG